jgi:glutamate synthase (NADPH/NADH) large chain
MSGGRAWVLDLDRPRLNTELVDPLPLAADDVGRVRALLGEHRDETGSAVAARLLTLADAELAARFTLLLPRDYARVLRARDEALAAGLDEAATTEKMMEASHG